MTIKLEMATFPRQIEQCRRQVLFSPCVFCGGTTDSLSFDEGIFCHSCHRRFDIFGNFREGVKVNEYQRLG